MSSMINKILFLIIGLTAVCTAFGQGRLEGRASARRFVSDKYGFSIAVPPRWLVDPSRDTPMYFSFSPADAGEFNRQLKLPKGGAVISIVAQESLRGRQYHSLSEWAEADARGVSAERPSIRPFELSADTGVAAAIISSYDSATFGPDDQSEHRLNIFWEFRQQLFVAHLLYPTHDARGAELKVLLDTVRSIRPLRNPEKR